MSLKLINSAKTTKYIIGKKPKEDIPCEKGRKFKRQIKLLDRHFVEDELDLVLDQVRGVHDDILDDNEDLDFLAYNGNATKTMVSKLSPSGKSNHSEDIDCMPVQENQENQENVDKHDPISKRGKLIIDKDSEKDMKITVLLGTDENGTKIIPPGLTPLERNDSSITLKGHDAAFLLEKIQGLGNFTANP